MVCLFVLNRAGTTTVHVRLGTTSVLPVDQHIWGENVFKKGSHFNYVIHIEDGLLFLSTSNGCCFQRIHLSHLIQGCYGASCGASTCGDAGRLRSAEGISCPGLQTFHARATPGRIRVLACWKEGISSRSASPFADSSLVDQEPAKGKTVRYF